MSPMWATGLRWDGAAVVGVCLALPACLAPGAGPIVPTRADATTSHASTPPGSSDAAPEVAVAKVVVPGESPRRSGRNPFAFSADPITRAAPEPSAAVAAPTPADVIDVPEAVPLLSLIGIAEGSAGGSRTAIISSVGEVFLVTVGESVTSRYVVRGVTESSVELAERTTGQVMRLSLRGAR